MPGEGEAVTAGRLPYHPSYPSENVFSGKEIRTAERVATALENYLLTGIRNAQFFKPSKNDIILVSGPRCGEEMLGRVLVALVSTNPTALAQIEESWNVPWIESRFADESPLDLTENFFSDAYRVLRTQMAMTMLNPRQHKGPKYVVLLRHPLDMRAEFFKYLRQCYSMKCNDPPRVAFDDVFPSPDSFVNVPVTLCQMSTVDPASYEQFVADWYRESRSNPDICLVFYEALISNPRREMTRLISFLEGRPNERQTNTKKKKDSTAAFQAEQVAIDETRLSAAMAIGRLADKSQREDSQARKVVARLKRVSVAIQRKARSLSKRSGSSSSGSRGSLFVDGDGGEGMGGSNYETPSSTRQIQNYWEQKVGLNPATYEKMYEAEIGESYPYPQLSMPKNPVALPTTSPLQTKLEAMGKAMSVARARLTTVVKSEIAEKVRSPVSALKPSRFLGAAADSSGEGDPSRNASNRDYAGSMLPAQAFTEQEWMTSTNLMSSAPRNDDVPEADELQITEASDLQRITTNDAAMTGQSAVAKFAAQEVMEANMLRSSMRLAGVDKAIVDVVAVKSEHLSEML